MMTGFMVILEINPPYLVTLDRRAPAGRIKRETDNFTTTLHINRIHILPYNPLIPRSVPPTTTPYQLWGTGLV